MDTEQALRWVGGASLVLIVVVLLWYFAPDLSGLWSRFIEQRQPLVMGDRVTVVKGDNAGATGWVIETGLATSICNRHGPDGKRLPNRNFTGGVRIRTPMNVTLIVDPRECRRG